MTSLPSVYIANLSLAYSLYTDGRYQPIQDGVSVRTMPLSHGHDHSGATYDSAAFFIRDNTSTQEFLFFGDVEPDSVASQPRLHDVWSAAAPKIPHTLHTIFIECSYPLGRQDNTLYGHLSPEHLSAELAVLAEEVVNVRRDLAEDDGPPHATRAQRARKRQRRNPVTAGELRSVLQGVRVYIIHCKEDMQLEYDRPMHEIIADQVRSLVDARGLGVEIIAATQGMHICGYYQNMTIRMNTDSTLQICRLIPTLILRQYISIMHFPGTTPCIPSTDPPHCSDSRFHNR